MTRSRMFLLTAGVAGALALAGCGGSDETSAPAEAPPPATTPEPATTAETQTTETEAATTTTETETEPAETETEPDDNALVVLVRGGQPVGGVQKIEVKSGDRVRFVVRADAPEEVHVHGYDIAKDVSPGQPARFDFVADLEGIFEAELENSSVQIIQLVVEP
jgi:plastocyanin